MKVHQIIAEFTNIDSALDFTRFLEEMKYTWELQRTQGVITVKYVYRTRLWVPHELHG